MSMIVAPGFSERTVISTRGGVLKVPEDWGFLQPGDAALTRRVKLAGEHWVVQERQGRKIYTRGVWAPAATIERIRAELAAERSTAGYAKRRQATAKRRQKAQVEYVEDFFGAVVAFLDFHTDYADLAQRLARAVTEHTTPVGSGTVARTKRIPVAQRTQQSTRPGYERCPVRVPALYPVQ